MQFLPLAGERPEPDRELRIRFTSRSKYDFQGAQPGLALHATFD